MDWSKYEPYFKPEEFRCSFTGDNFMSESFMDRLFKLRVLYHKPITITNGGGYRSKLHPVEVKKVDGEVGPHTTGHAVDIAVRGSDVLVLIKYALDLGFTGFGISQKGASRFLHLDDIGATATQPRPTIWSY